MLFDVLGPLLYRYAGITERSTPEPRYSIFRSDEEDGWRSTQATSRTNQQ